MESRDLDRDVAGCAGSHQRLLADLDTLTDEQARQPSLLPGWTVGHVVTHLARNAESHVAMLEAAEHGESVPQYPGGVEQRIADIARGAGRPAAELVSDARRTVWALEAAWAGLSVGWHGHGLTIRGPLATVDMPFARWREVVVHHSDLGLGFTCEEWPPTYVRVELARMTALWASRQPMGLTTLPAAALATAEPQRLAWLLGRAEIDGLAAPGLLS